MSRLGVILALPLGVLLASVELSLALLSLAPRTRRAAVVLALLFHGGLLATLASHHWNYAIWPWNVAVAAAAVLLIWPWREGLRHSLRAQPRWSRTASCRARRIRWAT